MKNFNLFMNEKKEKLKIAGSIVGGVTIIALSSCNVSDIKNDNSSVETSILSSVSTTTISNNNTPSYSTTSNKNQTTTKETTTQTTTSTTTKAPETITTTTNEVIITPSPVTTNIPATEKPVESTTKFTTKETQTTTKTTTTKKEEPIEYETKTDEITGYYNNFESNKTIELTKQNINNYNDFMSSTEKFYFSIAGPFVQYHTYANLDTGKYENYETDSYIERILLVTLLNEKYINERINYLKDIAKIDPWNDYSIPEVINTIIQTTGRLWRSPGDKGTIGIFDPRLDEKFNYILDFGIKQPRQGIKINIINGKDSQNDNIDNDNLGDLGDQIKEDYYEE